MKKEDIAIKETLEIIDELLIEYMKPHSPWQYMEQIQELFKKNRLSTEKQKSRQRALSTKEI